MSFGSKVRKLFGQHERKVADMYRRIYVSLDDLTSKIIRFSPSPNKILEVGCGEGAMTEFLCKLYPNSEITAIDISPSVGRLFEGKSDNVRFLEVSLSELISREPSARYDLVIISDVIHHVATGRQKLLQEARDILVDNGKFVLKDMAKSYHPIFLLGYFSDYYITGDKHVSFHTTDEFDVMIRKTFGNSSIEKTDYIQPWKVNIIFFVNKQ